MTEHEKLAFMAGRMLVWIEALSRIALSSAVTMEEQEIIRVINCQVNEFFSGIYHEG